jgi:histidinol dehydrogenase
MMVILDASNVRALERLVARNAARRPDVERQAARIVRDVRRRGDAAVLDWTRRLDAGAGALRLSLEPLGSREIEAGWNATPPVVRRAVRTAVRHIRRVARSQVPSPLSVEVTPGVTVRRLVRPLDRVGCYVPGGRYPLPSTLLMTVVPARVAGVREVIVTCPRPSPAVLCAALEAGATSVLRLGGAQAIAALAYGTTSIPRVDKIVGPGNAWVAAAKTIVSADCPIDFQAGPSEIVVYTDDGRRPDWIAADLIAQAEHDPEARAILITSHRTLARRVAAEIHRRMPAAGPARAALARNGAIVVVRSDAEGVALVNRLAPEHLVCDRGRGAEFVAGTIFEGAWSAQAAGDYCTGSNHVLPTGGAARFRGGLSAADFVRVNTVQRLTQDGLKRIAGAVVALADAEGLTAHAESIRVRLRPPARGR